MLEYILQADKQVHQDWRVGREDPRFLGEVQDQAEFLYQRDAFNGERVIEMHRGAFTSAWNVYLHQLRTATAGMNIR